MAKNYFKRYVWLIETIENNPHSSLSDISRRWQRSSLNEDGSPLAERTFHNHREAIVDTFGIEIRCDRASGYYIANTEDIDGGSIKQWLLESISVNNLLNESVGLKERIIFEEIPSAHHWLSVIVSAMRDGKALMMTYQSFWRDRPCSFEAHPYCLKLFKQRWYLLAQTDGEDYPFIYSLDRILNLEPMDNMLEYPDDFSPSEFFAHFYGVILNDEEPTTVTIRVDKDQVKYFDSLPLHHSQVKIETEDDYSVYQYYLVPTFDFKQEILRHGASVIVISPDEFRNEIINGIKAMAEQYGL